MTSESEVHARLDIPYSFIVDKEMPMINGVFLNGLIYEYSIETISAPDSPRRKRAAVFTGTSENICDDGGSVLCATYEARYEKQGLLLECGEGSWGGDGFICLSDTDKRVIFLAFFDTANPFIVGEYKADRIRAMNNLGELWTFVFDGYTPPSIKISEEDPVNMNAWAERENW